jgi:hypothetical protein
MKIRHHATPRLNCLLAPVIAVSSGLPAQDRQQDIFLAAPFASFPTSTVMELRNDDLLGPHPLLTN